MSAITFYRLLIYCTAIVWLANGLFCKVLNLVPRHEEIVARILGNEFSGILTLAIGISEVLMAIWIFSGIKARLNALTQIMAVAAMNFLEFIIAPDLLLWGRWNSFFAFLFILVVFYNEFVLNKKSSQTA